MAHIRRSARGRSVRGGFEALFAGRVERNADEHQHDGKRDDGDKGFHGYSLPMWSIRRSIWTPVGAGEEPQEIAAVVAAPRGPEAQRRH